ncbi:MAG: hypothetical protein V1916_03410 [Patescibacteria group bacterium]
MNPDRPTQPDSSGNRFNSEQLMGAASFWQEYSQTQELSAQSDAEKRGKRKQYEKYGGIVDTLAKYSDLLRSAEDPLVALQQEIDQLQRQMGTAAEDELRHLDEQVRTLEDVAEFIAQQLDRPESSPAFNEWKRARAGEAAQYHGSAEQTNPTGAQEEIDQRELEKVREKILLDALVKNGSTVISTSLPTAYHPTHHAGFTSRFDSRRKDSADRFVDSRITGSLNETLAGNYRDVLKKAVIDEAVQIVPATEDVYGEVQVQGTESRLGGLFSKQVARTERRKTGTRQLTHREAVAGSTVAENAYALRYLAEPATRELEDQYKDYSGRYGQFMHVETIIPESLAVQVAEQLRTKPEFIRTIVRELVTKNLSIPEEAWDVGDQHTHSPLRPPYEAWAKRPGGSKMYIEGPDAQPGEGLRSERVFTIYPPTERV